MFTTGRVLLLTAIPFISAVTLDPWLHTQYNASLDHIHAAFFHGAIRASPTSVQPNPDYNYNWVRDAALTMSLFSQLFELQPNRTARDPIKSMFTEYLQFNTLLQAQRIPNPRDTRFNASELDGEPKYNLNGSLFWGNWMRPQNDGPALRVMALGGHARQLQHNYDNSSRFYYNYTNTTTVIYKDLEYTRRMWTQASFDVWEEVKGLHFYTLMAQRRAFLVASRLAHRENSTLHEMDYLHQAQRIERKIQQFWDAQLGQINCTRYQVDGLKYKQSQLDMQVILAALHSGAEEEAWFDPADDRVLSTFTKLVDAFEREYPVNHKSWLKDRGLHGIGVALGRYPEDQYTGYNATHNGGNPWMLLTAAAAELCYRVATTYRHRGEIKVTRWNQAFLRRFAGIHAPVHTRIQGYLLDVDGNRRSSTFIHALKKLVQSGDAFMKRVQVHVEHDHGHLSEQWNRVTGEQQGAQDLTWSYVAFMTALLARQDATLLF